MVHDVLGMALNRITLDTDPPGGAAAALGGAKAAPKAVEVGEGDFFWELNCNQPFPKVAADVDVQLGKYKEVGVWPYHTSDWCVKPPCVPCDGAETVQPAARHSLWPVRAKLSAAAITKAVHIGHSLMTDRSKACSGTGMAPYHFHACAQKDVQQLNLLSACSNWHMLGTAHRHGSH